MSDTTTQWGTVVAGHGVASGRAGDPRFPQGTLRLQFPIFAALGVDLAAFHPATINVALDGRLDLGLADHVLRRVAWHEDVGAEDFSLWNVGVVHHSWRGTAVVYRPHPETKPDHHQPADVIELLTPWIQDLAYGDRVQVEAMQGRR